MVLRQGQGAGAPARAVARPGLTVSARSATGAVGIVAAMSSALNVSSGTLSGQQLQWLVISSRERGHIVRATNMGRGETTPVLAGIQLAALEPVLKPSDQLRYRIGSPVPARPTRSTLAAETLASALPTALCRCGHFESPYRTVINGNSDWVFRPRCKLSEANSRSLRPPT
jgi:hypothetical protein